MDHLLASIYTYGNDYHSVLKSVTDEALKDEDYISLTDNHNLDERTILEISGLAYRGKNNLMINKDFGSYFFITLILTKKRYKEVIFENNDSCGDCMLCIKACPMNALIDGFNEKRCLSSLNQLKEPLTDEAIEKNYLLLGCDICQRVCPKNRNIKTSTNQSLQPRPTAYVLIDDLFNLSNKEFLAKYNNHAYNWRGKTLLLRNALTILLKNKNIEYNEKIKKTILDPKYPKWYVEDAKKIYKKLQNFKI